MLLDVKISAMKTAELERGGGAECWGEGVGGAAGCAESALAPSSRHLPTAVVGARGRLTLGLPGGSLGGRKGGGALWSPYQQDCTLCVKCACRACVCVSMHVAAWATSDNSCFLRFPAVAPYKSCFFAETR